MSLPYRGALAGGASLDERPLGVLSLLAGAALAALVALFALGLATLPAPPAPSIRAHAAPTVPQRDLVAGLPASLAPAASATIGASERRFWPDRHGGALRADGGGIKSAFGASGAQLSVPAGTVSMSLASAGRGERLAGLGAVAPSAATNTVLYRHGSITEFYRNGPYGLEQGFTLHKRPAGDGTVVLGLRVGGTLAPRQAGSQIVFATPRGAAALRYGQLSVVDASGRQLPAHMQLSGRTLQLRADDSGARYPLRIDPFFQQGPKLTASGETGKAIFGLSTALSADGNTALIGGPNDNANVGAAWVFTRTGST
ncbi:MAG TPA: hypothetical protein VNY34_00610, partial [Solirubrobacteraceae bacterium]|nr:hypothetical protein [Solirubrobacteraceae bacterium]